MNARWPLSCVCLLLAVCCLMACGNEEARRRAEAEKRARELERAHQDGAKYRKEMNEGTTDAIRKFQFPDTSKSSPTTPGGGKK